MFFLKELRKTDNQGWFQRTISNQNIFSRDLLIVMQDTVIRRNYIKHTIKKYVLERNVISQIAISQIPQKNFSFKISIIKIYHVQNIFFVIY